MFSFISVYFWGPFDVGWVPGGIGINFSRQLGSSPPPTNLSVRLARETNFSPAFTPELVISSCRAYQLNPLVHHNTDLVRD